MSTAFEPIAFDTHRLETVSLLEAGRLLGMSRDVTYKRNKAEEFPVPVRLIAGRMRVRLIDLEAFLDATFT